MIRTKLLKGVSAFLAVSMLYQVVFPTMAYALTGGPSQPEVESFEPVGTTQMVDPFTGDFNYNIPLLDIDGYPVNMAYHSGVTMDQEASWVGLGWNLNPGVINRSMRGMPDDFSGGSDLIEKNSYIKPQFSFGISVGTGIEFFGKEGKAGGAGGRLDDLGLGLNVGLGINYDNYRGLGIENELGIMVATNKRMQSHTLQKLGLTGTSISLNSSSKDGFEIQPRLGLQYPGSLGGLASVLGIRPNVSIDMAFNTRSGMKDLTFSGSIIRPNGIHSRSVFRMNSQISFGTSTYTPTSPLQINNRSYSFQGKVGVELKALTLTPYLKGYQTKQHIAELHQSLPGYGYLNSEKADEVDEALMDFNREKDGSFSDKSPVLSIPVYTHDVFSASGQGVGGMYRAFRSDIGVVKDRTTSSRSNGDQIHLEFSTTDVAKGALQWGTSTFKSTTGSWERNNGLAWRTAHKDKDISKEPLYEPAYFKAVGEKNANEENLLAYAFLDNPVRPALFKDGSTFSTDANALVKKVGSDEQTEAIASYKRAKTERAKRTDLMTVKTVAERAFCSQQNIYYYTPSANAKAATYSAIDRAFSATGMSRPGNHITEVTVTNTQGTRYVYGIPAYNNVEYDLSFTNAYDPEEDGLGAPVRTSDDILCGEVPYDYQHYVFKPENFSAPDRDKFQEEGERRKWGGLNRYYECSKIPAYAHSYLLTEVQSQDYVPTGFSGAGSHDGAVGAYTKFNYYYINRTANGSPASYKWRVPVAKGKANYNPGYRSHVSDDGANFMYGEKEVWLMRSIEGRNHIAYFYISKREDALGVEDMSGGKSIDQRSYKLDKIELYAKTDLNTPLKTVHFEYDYSLCPGVENNSTASVDKNGNSTSVPADNVNAGKGKLTLKKVYFTYGSSTKGKFNAYVFKYDKVNVPVNDTRAYSINPGYNLKGYDRWGNYKPNNTTLSNSEFPYTKQPTNATEKIEVDEYASAWSLTDITLPSGGNIHVTYESDDYAYVQDRRAMRMYKIKGFGETNSEGGMVQELFRNANILDPTDWDRTNVYMFFDLPAGSKISAERFKNDILGGEQKNLVYYNCLVNLTKASDATKNYEYVRGYAEVEDAGINQSNNIGWVKLRKNEDYHPIAKSAWQLARLYLPQKIYPGSDLMNEPGTKNAVIAAIRGLFGYIYDLSERVQGVYGRLRSNEYGCQVDLNKSFVRLNEMTGFKRGGGSRVKKIELSDNWANMGKSGAKTAVYGQEFDYTTTEYYNGGSYKISSGVASYEPSIGNDENPFKRPVSYTNNNVGVPDDEFYAEEPFGEAFFPAPVVGYSKITVKNIVPRDANGNEIDNKAHRTGKTINTFYTAREFPTIVDYTKVDPHEVSPSGIFSISNTVKEKYLTASQGFQVELNDMHGKPKSVLYYSQAKIDSELESDAASGVSYEYQVVDPDAHTKKLDNNCQVITSDNVIATRQVGVEADMVMDGREWYSRAHSGSLGLNLDFFTFGIVPLLTALVWPEKDVSISGFRSAVVSRVIQRYGILKKTTIHDEGAKTSAENILFDAETGAVVLSKNENEFKDNIYNATYPAYWVKDYAGMGPAYKNINAELYIKSNSSYGFTPVVNGADLDPQTYFVSGDEVILNSPDGMTKAWIFRSSVSGKWMLIDNYGYPKTLASGVTYKIKIIRSGRRNMQSANVAEITSLQSPISGTSLQHNTASKIINASVVEFSDKWRTHTAGYAEATNCNYIFDENEQYIPAMKTEFETKLVPMIYNTALSPARIIQGCGTVYPSNKTFTEQELSQAPKIYKLFTDYRACQGIELDVTAYMEQSQDLVPGSNPNSTTRRYDIIRKLTFVFQIGTFKFELRDYKVIMPYHYAVGSLTCKDELIPPVCTTAMNTTLSAPVANLDNIAMTVWTGPPTLEKKTVTPLVKFQYNVASPNYTYTHATLGSVNYGVQEWVCNQHNPTTIASINFTGSRMYASDEDCPSLCSYVAGSTAYPSAQYLTSVGQTINDFLFGASSLAPIQKYLHFVKDVSTLYTGVKQNQADASGTVTTEKLGNLLPPCVASSLNTIVNPYQKGILGNWRPLRSWVYFDKRSSSYTNQTNIRVDGTYNSYDHFWQPTASGWVKDATPASNWKLQSENTKYFKFGDVVENKDALNIYTTSLINEATGYPYAAAQNARYAQIANDNMEDYAYDTRTISNCPMGHFNYAEVPNSQFVISPDAHTGRKSMQLPATAGGTQVPTFRQLIPETPGSVDDADGYKLHNEDFNGQFSPTNGEYLVSAWVKVENAAKTTTYANGTNGAKIKVALQLASGNPVTVTEFTPVELYPSGPIIEGWQRIEGRIKIDNSASPGSCPPYLDGCATIGSTTIPANRISVTLVGCKSKITWFDDLRILPLEASMKTFVYDPVSQRMMAELDENNYATFFEYDAEGKLTRTRRETERGIVTITESRSGQYKAQ
jgi:hypothetical protein